MALELRGDFDASMLRLAAKGSKNGPEARRRVHAKQERYAARKANKMFRNSGLIKVSRFIISGVPHDFTA